MKKKGIKGTLRVYGGAAEETEGAKVYMARDGLFDDVDTMLHWHPLDKAVVANIRTTAITHVYVEFNGKTAHAGMAPWEGRSALDAVELFLHGVNLMREHVLPTCRIHYIVKNGGLAPNIVPDKASVVMTFRGESRGVVNDGVAWIKEMVDGAARMTQTRGMAVDYYGMYDTLPNTPLAERMQGHMEAVGLPRYTKEEIRFAKKLQKEVGLEQAGMASAILPLPNEVMVGGSTDVGDVSWNTPTMGLLLPSSPSGIGVHTWMATASHGSSIGIKSAVMAAKVMAMTGMDVLTDDAFLKEVKADFKRRTKGKKYISPIRDEIKEPIGLPDEMRSHGSIIELKEDFYKQAGDDAFFD